MKYFRYILLSFFLAFTSITVFAQGNYPIFVQTTLMPPYSLRLSDYGQPGGRRLVVTLRVNDVTITNLPVRLHIKMETFDGRGVETAPNISVVPTYLGGGETAIFFGEDLAPYFNINNLVFKGYSREQYQRTGQLPEGFYRITVEVRHFGTGRLISNQGSATAWFALGKPPFLKYPDDAAELGEIAAVPLTFTWQPNNVGIPGANIQYTFELWEMRIDGINPNVIVASMPKFYDYTQFHNTLVLQPAALMLEPGMRYAWRVTASDVMGNVPFENNGHSEVRTFTYMCKCDEVKNLTVTQKNKDAVYTWDKGDKHTSFIIDAENLSTGYKKQEQIFNNKYELKQLDYDNNYRLRVKAVCNGNTMYPSDVSNWLNFQLTPLVSVEERCANCACEPDNSAEPQLTNTNWRTDLKAGDIVEEPSGNTRFQIVTASQITDGVYEGQFYFMWDYYGVKMLANYTNLRVNTENKIRMDYVFETVYDPSMMVDVDFIKEVVGAVNTLFEKEKGIDDILKKAEQEYESGNITQEKYDSINAEGNNLKQEIEKLKQEEEGLNKLTEGSEEYNNRKLELEELAQSLNKRVDDFIQRVDAELGTLITPTDSFFDGMIQYSSRFDMQDASIEFGRYRLNYQKQSDGNDANQGYSYESNTVIIQGESVGFYYISDVDSIKKYYELNDDGYAVFFYFDEKNKSISYKIKFKDSFFKNIYGIDAHIDHAKYVPFFNDFLKDQSNINNANKGDFDFFVNAAWGLNEMLSSANSILDTFIDEVKPELIDLTQQIWKVLLYCWDKYDIKKGIIPECLWERDMEIAFYAGAVDGLWETVILAGDIVVISSSFSVASPYFYTPGGKKKREEVFEAIGSILALSKEDIKKGLSDLKQHGLDYWDETTALTPQAAYNWGKLTFDVASLFIGVGEIKAIAKGAKVTTVLANSVKNLGKGLVQLTKAAGNLVKTGYIKTVKMGQIVVLKTLLEIEIARFGSDGILHITKWIDEPVEIIAKVSDDAIQYTYKGVAETAELYLVKGADGVEGIGKAMYKFTQKQIDDFVKESTHIGNKNKDKVMLGEYIEKSSLSYDEVAKKGEYTYFSMEDKWNKAVKIVDNGDEIHLKAEMWKINKQFIDEQRALGKEFYFAQEPWKFPTGKFRSLEAEYLIDLGAKDFIEIGNNIWKVIW